MAAVAFVFPGQGSQHVGMGRDLYEDSPSARTFFKKADAILGFPLTKICFQGPEDELRQTRNTQPAIFVHSMALMSELNDLAPAMVAGHSLGEYSALVAAGALSFEDGLRLIRLRGELMQRAGELNEGTMAAVVGLTPDILEDVCTQASSAGIVQQANLNAPGQIVISGSISGVHKAMAIAKARGAKLVKELVVSGAFHSPLMESARDGLKSALDETAVRHARIPVYANVTAEPVSRAEEIKELLYRQVTSPVRWEQSVRNMVRDGASAFYEIGPGKVLQGLIRRMNASVEVGGFADYADIKKQAQQHA